MKDAREEKVVIVIQSAKPLATVVWITLFGRLKKIYREYLFLHNLIEDIL